MNEYWRTIIRNIVVIGFVFVIVTLLQFESDVTIADSHSAEVSERHHNTSNPSITVDAMLSSTNLRVDEVGNLVSATKIEIWNNWNVTYFPKFLALMHVPEMSWQIQKAKFLKTLLENSIDASFVVGFSGSSVTAGHDNYFNESYPKVFQQTFDPILKALNPSMQLAVRNQAMGNNPCYPYDACVATHMGEDLDILTWEQSMNCGHNSKPVDSFCRRATMMPKKPTLMFLQSGTPAWSEKDCANVSAASALSRPPMTQEEKDLLSLPLKDIVRRTQFLTTTMDFLKDDPHEHLSVRYRGLAPMGQNVLGIEAYKCYGPYDSKFSLKTPGPGADWHPGKRGHRLRSDSIVYTLLSIMEDAVTALQGLRSFAKSYGPSATLEQTDALLLQSQGSSTLSEREKVAQYRTFDRITATAKAITGKIVADNAQLLRTANATAPKNGTTAAAANAPVGGRRLGNDSATVLALLDYSTSMVPSASPAASNRLMTMLNRVLSLNNTVTAAEGEAIAQYLTELAVELRHYFHAHPEAITDATAETVLFSLLREYVKRVLATVQSLPIPAVDDKYNLRETNQPATCYTNYEPRVGSSIDHQVVYKGSWVYDVCFLDKAAVAKAAERGLGYVDRKNIFLSSGQNSTMVMRVEVKTTNPIWLCECQKGFAKYPDGMGDLPQALDVYLSKEATFSEKLLDSGLPQWRLLGLDPFYDQCYRSAEAVEAGNYLLMFKQKGALQGNVAYVVTW